MKRRFIFLVAAVLAAAVNVFSGCAASPADEARFQFIEPGEKINLPEPRLKSDVSLEESLAARRSVRSYTAEPLTLNEVSQLLWAAQGITDDAGHRTAPSAVAIYPLTIFTVIGNVPEITPGIYIYEAKGHSLKMLDSGDFRKELAAAAMGQASVSQGSVSFVITADFAKVTSRFGEKGERFATLEAGHAAQNLCLQAAALDLGVVTAGAIDDEKTAEVLNLPDYLTPLYVIPAGRME